MKKIMVHSLVFAIGASIFLYSDQLFVHAAIYDPLDPKNTIIPIPNDDEATTSTSTITETTVESSTMETVNSAASDQKIRDAEYPKVTTDLFSASLVPQKEETKKKLIKQSPYLPKMKKPSNNPVLMLDDAFFSQNHLPVVPPDGSGGDAGSDEGFSDIAISAYFLAGIALFGSRNENLEAGMSE